MLDWWTLDLWFWSWILFFWSRFFSELGAEEWTSGGMVIMVDVTGGFKGVPMPCL